MSDETPLTWHDVLDLGLEGRGWDDTPGPFHRLPARAEGRVTDPVWRMSRHPTGMAVRFRTDAREIHTRWLLTNEQMGERNYNVLADSGLDLYGRDQGTWRWVAGTHQFNEIEPTRCIAEGLDGQAREYMLYLPLRNPVKRVEVGVPVGTSLTPAAPRPHKPIVAYGTSIIHGAYATRPGLVYTSMIGRRLDREVINLGFSGSARMEIDVADLLGELDPAAYLIDPLPNMDLALVNERAEAFIRRLRQHRPTTPVVLVEDFPRTNAWIMPAKRDDVAAKVQRYREIIDALVAEGVPRLHYVSGHDLLGTDGETSIDGIHPNDLGYFRMADKITPVMKAALGEAGA